MTMRNDVSIRMAQPEDSQAILNIYAPYIKETAITFTSKVPTVADVEKTMVKIKRHYPYLVCAIDTRVVGFAYANWVRPHEAYRWNAELSVYLDPAYQGRGIATALYTALFSILRIQGFCNLYAVITLPNDASVALHEHFGFTELGVHRANGYKLGAWRDVLWMEYRLSGAPEPDLHGPPLPLSKLNRNDVDTALAMATALLNGVR
ncbi:MAG: GNAT family N-acetyltransferase [Coriobacteriales bacterium]|nr:GNAT family N-acetyltransferase [Coriobacteriales bacterium]